MSRSLLHIRMLACTYASHPALTLLCQCCVQGRPKGPEDKSSLKHVVESVSDAIGLEVSNKSYFLTLFVAMVSADLYLSVAVVPNLLPVVQSSAIVISHQYAYLVHQTPCVLDLRAEVAYCQQVQLAPDCIGNEVQAMVDKLQPGQVLLLENVRFHKQEERNDPEFAKQVRLVSSPAYPAVLIA